MVGAYGGRQWGASGSATFEDIAATDDLTVTDKVNVGGTTTMGTTTADSSAAAAANDLVIKGSTSPGLSIIESGVTGTCSIYMGDSASSDQGRIVYDNNGDFLLLYTADVNRMYLTSTFVVFPQANADMFLGATTAASGGTTQIRVAKGAAGTATLALQSDEGGTYQNRGQLQIDASEVVQLSHHDTSGAEDAKLSIAAALATFSSATVVLFSGGMRTPHRELAADAALTLAQTDAGGTIELNITSGTTVVTMTALAAGSEITVYAGIRSGGAYTLAATRGATSGTVTIDAVGEGVIIKYNGSAWKVVSLLGGATFT